MAQINADFLQRMLVAKHLLAANRDQLTPNSDAAAVARMVLAAHDAAELAVAAIASHLKVPGLTERMSLPEYAPKIEAQTNAALSGSDYLKQLNAVRVNFKHHGVLPDARTWYRVVDNVWGRVDDWCGAYLGVALDDIDLEQLLADPDVKILYEVAKKHYGARRYREALEALGRALYSQLDRFPGMIWPRVGSKSTEDALMLAAFGVRPSDYLTLQDLLPSVTYVWKAQDVVLEWNAREKGHEGNWSEPSVRFCLETFLDLALKVQHAPLVPYALSFDTVFDDVITPTGATADLFKWEYEPENTLKSMLTGSRQVKGRVVVKTLKGGESLRCRLFAAEVLDKPQTVGFELGDLAKREPTVETAAVLSVFPPNDFRTEPMYVERTAVRMDKAVRDDPWVRQMRPHLFGTAAGT